MTSVFPENSRLKKNDRIGKAEIRGFDGSDALGEHYSAVLGVTGLLVGIVVPPVSAGASAAFEYRAFIDATAPVRKHPCLMHYFTTAKEGDLPWIRADRATGAPDWAFETNLNEQALEFSEEIEGLRVDSLAHLLEVSGGVISPKDRAWILGDVLEGLAALHSAGLHCGNFEPENIVFDKAPNKDQVTARLRTYAFPASGLHPASADFLFMAPLIRALCLKGDAKEPFDASLAAFASDVSSGRYRNGGEAYRAFQEIAARHGHEHADHFDSEAADPFIDRERINRLREGAGAADDDARPSRISSFESSSENARRVMAFLRFFGVIFLMSIIGIAVYAYLCWADERDRRHFSADSLGMYSSVRIIPLDENEEHLRSLSAGVLPDDVFRCTPAQVESAAQAGNPIAIAFCELNNVAVPPGGTLPASVFDIADERMVNVQKALERDSRDSTSAAFLYAHSLLLGLGVEAPQPEKALSLLKQAGANGCVRAYLLLGDWCASDVAVPDVGASRVERDRQAIAYYRLAAATESGDSPKMRAEGVRRAVSLLRHGRGVKAGRENDYAEWLGAIAGAGSVSALAFLSEPDGIVVEEDHAASLAAAGMLAERRDVPEFVRAWANVRIARHFEKGLGVGRDEAKARELYESAAKVGNADAIRAMADFCEKGVAAKNGGPDPDAAQAWRAQLAVARPDPEFFDYTPYTVTLGDVRRGRGRPKETELSLEEAFFSDEAVEATRRSSKANTAARIPAAKRVRKTGAAESAPAPAPLTPLTP